MVRDPAGYRDYCQARAIQEIAIADAATNSAVASAHRMLAVQYRKRAAELTQMLTARDSALSA